MISKAHANAVLLDQFNSVPVALPTRLWFGLYTADPGATGTQATNEVGYPTYNRIDVGRTAAEWDVLDGPDGLKKAVLKVKIEFPQVTAGPGSGAVATHFALGDQPSTGGAGVVRFRGVLDSPITCAVGKTPRLIEGLEIFICETCEA